ncbi:MAG: single-stranded-DNA-specific exonuclease RecJ [Pyrinomonadaceae bacterium]|nr:single-stranded-DNA-specific exonuclease RecJ [Pyrinomonadaceae bacterium]MCX7638866.1 single-stranded-DNA-specific exonuclease RecJ [Pyrinomonadaceae bacterium]MDW8304998.1 single-stranded-DNA-specific exonuclease RecJ [Acidobacteriota bacterium]
MRQSLWEIRSYTREERDRIRKLANELGVKELIAACLINRGFDDPSKAHEFLYPSKSDLISPFLMKDLEKAVERIIRAIRNRENVWIWGDYDVDGTTGAALLRKTFRFFGFETSVYIPHRIKEGYGINCEGIKRAISEGVKLIISVDTGSTSFEAIRLARESGIDVIITDHHAVSVAPSGAYAFINPHQAGCFYPNKSLAGVGVAFKLASGLMERLGCIDLDNKIDELLELAAVGTIADVVELTGENRTIVSCGLKNLNKTKNLGLRALIEVADCTNELNSYEIGFRIAPRINAAGRLDHAKIVVELLETNNIEQARQIAKVLDEKNRERQVIQENSLLEACSKIEKQIERTGKIPDILMVYSENIHLGVAGLVASKLMEKYNRAAMVGCLENGKARFSVRSTASVDAKLVLEYCSDILEKYGGHKSAAGFEIKVENIPILEEKLIKYAYENNLDYSCRLDVEALVKFSTIDYQLLNELKNFEPFGQGNPKPLFLTSKVSAESVKIMKEKHLKFRLVDVKGLGVHEAVFWNGVEKVEAICRGHRGFDGENSLMKKKIDIVYDVGLNRWNGLDKIQLQIKDLRFSD